MKTIAFSRLATLFFIVAALRSTNAAAEEIPIGAVLQLSGDQAEWGHQVREGADVAIEIIRAEHLLNGRTLRIIYEDGKGVPTESLSALRRLISLKHVPAFITQASAVTMALTSVSNGEKVIQMDVGSTTPAYRTKDDFTFRTAVTSLQLASGLAKAIVAEKISQVAVIYQEDDYGNGVQETFRAAYTSQGGTIPIAEAFQPNESNFRSQLLHFKMAPAIVVVARYSIAGTLIKQAREVGINSRLFGDSYTVESDEVIRTAGKSVEGFTYVAPYYPNDRNTPASKFLERFRSTYHKEPVQLSAQAHDGVMAIALALNRCPKIEPECLRSAMQRLSFEGASGLTEFDSMGDVKGRPTILKTVRDGKFVIADSVYQ